MTKIGLGLQLRFLIVALGFILPSCAVFATRPVQEMSDTAAAIRAAREVQANELAPDVFRRASELFFRARREYKFKNFAQARELAFNAKRLAEQAEFDAIRSGATRVESTSGTPYEDLPSDPTIKGPESAPESSPTAAPPEEPDLPVPSPTPAEAYEERKKKEQELEAAKPVPNPTPTPKP